MQFNNIYPSKDNIKLDIINYFKENLQLENDDFEKNSYISHIINVLTNLYQNTIFSTNLCQRENNLSQQKMLKSVKNIQKIFGQDFNNQYPQEGIVTFTIDLTNIIKNNNNFTILIPPYKNLSQNELENNNIDLNDLTLFNEYDNFYVYKQNIPYIIEEYIILTYSNNFLSISTQNKETFEYQNIDFSFYEDGDKINNNIVIFDLPVKQYEKKCNSYNINNSKSLYKILFYEKTDKYIYDINVYSKNLKTNQLIKWSKYDYFDNMTSNTYGYIIEDTDDNMNIIFGNGINGIIPQNNDIFYIEYKETLGFNGSCMPNELTSSDQISIKLNDIDYIITPNIINKSQIGNGENEDTIEDIRINQLNKLKSNNMLLTENDFKNIKNIYNTIFDISEGYIQQNDILSNKISIYNTLKYNDKIVPLYSLNLKIKKDEISSYKTLLKYNYLIPEEIINKDLNTLNKEYIQLFDIIFDSNYQIQNYVISKKNISQKLNNINVKNDVLNFTGVNFKYLSDDTYDIFLFTNKLNKEYNDEKITLNIISEESNKNIQISEFSKLNEDENQPLIFKYNISKNEIPYSDLILNIKYVNESIEYKFYGNIEILKILNNMMSYIEEETLQGISYYNIYQVPQIDKEYFINLDNNELLIEKLNNQVLSYDLSDKTIYDINLKFQNTDGTIYSLNYNKEKYQVLDIIDKNFISDDKIGDMYLILYNEITNEDSILYEKLNQIIKKETDVEYSFIEPSENDIIYIKNLDKKLIYSGSQWKTLNISNPVNIEVDVYCKNIDSTYIDIIKNSIYENLKNNFGLNKNIYKSDILKNILSFNFVSTAKIKNPSFDIIFEDLNIDKYSKQYIYINKDNIIINLKKI